MVHSFRPARAWPCSCARRPFPSGRTAATDKPEGASQSRSAARPTRATPVGCKIWPLSFIYSPNHHACLSSKSAAAPSHALRPGRWSLTPVPLALGHPRRIWPAALGPMQRCSECRTLARKRAAAAGVVGCAALPACCMNPSPQRPQPLSQPELCGQAVPTPPARRPCFSWPLEMIASALRRRSAYSGRPSPYGVVV